MLALLGFHDVIFREDNPNKVKSVKPHPLRGYLLATGIESNGRLVGLVYSGEPNADLEDGQRVFVDAARLDASVNAALVHEGLAYGELYTTMPLDLIKRMRQLVKDARHAGAGFWPHENLKRGTRVQLHGLSDLTDLVMFPKLYRRLVTYFADGHVGLGEFDAWVRADPVHRDDRALLPSGEVGNLHDLYDVDGNGIELLDFPEDLTFEPDPA
jgi:hypothetical protein